MKIQSKVHLAAATLVAAAAIIVTSVDQEPSRSASHWAFRLRAGALELRAVREGSGEPVILLHGFGESLLSWRAVFDRLAGRMDVVAVDLPGFGLSDKPASGYSTDSLALIVLRAMDALGMERAWVVGHSLGGAVATAVAANAPTRVRGLVLVAPAIVPARWTEPDGALASGGAEAVRAVISRYEAVRARFLSVHDPAWLAEDEGALAYTTASDPAYLVSTDAVLKEFDFTYLTPTVARRLTMPLMLFWGELDTTVPVSMGRRLIPLLPHAEFVSLPRTWHRPQVERPDEVAAAIESFLVRNSDTVLAHTNGER